MPSLRAASTCVLLVCTHVRTRGSALTAAQVPDVFAHGPQTEMEEYVQARKEAVYRSTQREPLGRPMQRGHVLPPQTQAADFKFGVATDASEAAGRVVYPEPQAESEEARALYKRSHKSYEPGEQIRRDYATDPRAMRHGVLERDWLGEGRGAALCLNPGMCVLLRARCRQRLPRCADAAWWGAQG